MPEKGEIFFVWLEIGFFPLLSKVSEIVQSLLFFGIM